MGELLTLQRSSTAGGVSRNVGCLVVCAPWWKVRYRFRRLKSSLSFFKKASTQMIGAYIRIAEFEVFHVNIKIISHNVII
jgi:hypothetical protein